MRHWLLSVAAAFVLVLAMNGSCFGDEMCDELITNTAWMMTIRSFATFTIIGKESPANDAENKAKLKSVYWAFQPDVHLTDAEVANETKTFDAVWASLTQVSLTNDIPEIRFIGCDEVVAPQCLDLYFATATPTGPIIFRFSAGVGVANKPRLYGMEIITGWDKVKQIVKGIEHPISVSRVPVFTPHPKDTTQPAVPNT